MLCEETSCNPIASLSFWETLVREGGVEGVRKGEECVVRLGCVVHHMVDVRVG